ncbi:hypothetical protein N665_0309s0017 [Sinapis alba]|nr:hypothetical protein N665_0309s0017 [Sinapis alba]
MAPLHLPFLLFVVVSVVVVSAVDKPSTTTSEAPAATTPTDVAEAPRKGNAIGTTGDNAAATPGDDNVAVAGSMGKDSSHANYPPPQQTSGSGGTATVRFAYVAAATVGLLFFFSRL